jgi:hypothetical protein
MSGEWITQLYATALEANTNLVLQLVGDFQIKKYPVVVRAGGRGQEAGREKVVLISEIGSSFLWSSLGEIPETENRLAQTLAKLARQFEFEQLVDLAEPLITNES